MANILAVDDEEDVRALLQAALARDGHTVKTLASGAAAVSYTHLDGYKRQECESHVSDNGEGCAGSRVRPDT